MIPDSYQLQSAFNDLDDTKVHEWFTDRLEEIKTQLIHCQEESTLRTLQGRGLMLSDILNSIESAKDKMIEHRRIKPTMSQSF